MKWYIGLGLASIVLATAAIGFLAVAEPVRMEEFAEAFEARRIETGAALFENNCRTCHGPQGLGISGVAPALQTAELFNGARLQSIGYAGTVEDFVRSTISAGRPVPSEGTNYPQRMPTWSQEYGGPLRNDEIESLVSFVMNWEQPALAAGGAEPLAVEDQVGRDFTIDLPEGDAENGRALADGALACTACHALSDAGPAWAAGAGQPGIGARADTRILQDDYTGQAESAQQYLAESVLQPNVFVVEGFEPNIMPGDYDTRLTPQELADLIAYMQTIR